MLDFSQKKRCVQAGIEAARKAVPRIREAIAAGDAARARYEMRGHLDRVELDVRKAGGDG